LPSAVGPSPGPRPEGPEDKDALPDHDCCQVHDGHEPDGPAKVEGKDVVPDPVVVHLWGVPPDLVPERLKGPSGAAIDVEETSHGVGIQEKDCREAAKEKHIDEEVEPVLEEALAVLASKNECTCRMQDLEACQDTQHRSLKIVCHLPPFTEVNVPRIKLFAEKEGLVKEDSNGDAQKDNVDQDLAQHREDCLESYTSH